MPATDPREIIERAPMSRAQVATVAIMVGLNALDGFDVLSISFAAPGIAADWGIDRVALGVVLSMELIGMAIGSVVLGSVADRVGRRRTILGCLCVMALGMAMATQATGVATLSVWRVLTGLGIGGMLAAINAVTAEFANARRRNLALAVMVIGYPLGAVIGGLAAAWLLTLFDWHAIFWFGCLATAAFIPLVWFLVPEPVQFLLVRRGPGTLARVNAVLARCGHPPVSALPPPTVEESAASIADILRPGLIGTTLLVTFAYFAHVVSFYFILKWVPKIVVDIGFPPPEAAGVLVWANLGGAIGGALFGVAVQRLPLKGATVAVLLGSSVMVALFGALGVNTLAGLSALAFASGLFTNSAVSGLYTIFARAFPTHVRATGTGFAIGVGRGGAALSPIVAGMLFEAGLPLAMVSTLIAGGSFLAAIALSCLKLRVRG
ncbi:MULTISPECIES: MFS transporter [unclassified Novosphingobium]|uniref:MFS transporter n=1 Tax=unclassified Novosphingobium TaxID=2644732 RepID=UPI0012C63C29|nr:MULTISPECIES: MFS transporter [unclassified Novosphingobium]MPS69726.1 MFS transporter [Novosphingobium sp.]WRT94983.1 MFS transporter [Novosphingobium sp. RL4]